MMNRIAEEVERDAVYRQIINAQRARARAHRRRRGRGRRARHVGNARSRRRSSPGPPPARRRLRIARERPEAPILALTPNRDTARRLTLAWGVHAVVTKDAQRRRRHGQSRLQIRRAARASPSRRAHHHHRRRALRHAGRDQYGANCFYGRGELKPPSARTPLEFAMTCA